MPTDPRDYKLSLGSLSVPQPGSAAAGETRGSLSDSAMAGGRRPFIGVTFACCNVYVRVYRSTDATHYLAHCPKCAKSVRFAVGDEGTDARSFVVR